MKQFCHIIWCVEKNMESKNPKVARTKNGRIMLLSKCAVCDSKKNIGIKIPLSKIPLVGPLLF